MAHDDRREGKSPLRTVPHVAERLSCSERFVWTLIARGDLTRIALSARATRIAESDVDAFIERAVRRRLPPGGSGGKAAKRARSARPGEQGN